MNEKKTAIIISGMHRSGTSSVAGVVSMLGATMPGGQLLSPKPDNPRGFFESERVYRLNDSILEQSGTHWSDWRAVNNEWQRNPSFPEFLEEASAIISDEYADSRFIFLKDPRFSKLLPFWNLALENSGFGVCHIVPFRHPVEVAASLTHLHPLSKNLVNLSWVRHVLDAELHSRKQPRVFIFWNDFLDNWERVATDIAEKFSIVWPRLTDLTRTEIEQFLSRELRHHRESPVVDSIGGLGNEYLDSTFSALRLLAKDPRSAKAIGVFETIRADYVRTERIYGPLFAEMDAQRHHVELDRDRSAARHTEAAILLEAERRRRRSLEIDCARLTDDLHDRDVVRRRNADLAAQVDQARSRFNDLSQSVEDKTAQVAELEARLNSCTHRYRVAQDRLNELHDLTFIRRIIRIFKNDDRKFSIESLAERMNLNELQLGRELKDLDPPAEFLELREVLRLNGVRFLVGAYGRLLNRQPDEGGISYYLPRLLDGTPKIEILAEIASSDEARALGSRLSGLSAASFLYRLSRLPLVGAIFRLLPSVEGKSAVDRRLRAIEQALSIKDRQAISPQSLNKSLQ